MGIQTIDVLNNVEKAFEKGNIPIIEKETTFIFLSVFQMFMHKFSKQIDYIKGDIAALSVNTAYLLSKEHLKRLGDWVERLNSVDGFTDSDFGKLKLDLEEWYYKVGGEELIIGYCDSYLLSISEVTEMLQISKPTLYKYIKVGFECLDTKSHKKIPKFAVDLWQNPVYMLKMQRLFQTKQMSKLTLADRYKEVNEEISELELSYGGEFSDIFGQYSGDDMDNWDAANDYRTWRDLIDEKKELASLIKKKNHLKTNLGILTD